MQPAVFFSYVHDDDLHDGGKIRRIANQLIGEVRAHLGANTSIDSFVDRDSLKWGTTWRTHIQQGIASATFFVPFVTPRYLESTACRDELSAFLSHEQDLGRADLILPLFYIRTPRVLSSEAQKADELAATLAQHEWVDWSPLRFAQLSSVKCRRQLYSMAERIASVAIEFRSAAIEFRSEEKPTHETRIDVLGEVTSKRTSDAILGETPKSPESMQADSGSDRDLWWEPGIESDPKIARSPHPPESAPAELPAAISEALESHTVLVREGAVRELGRLLESSNTALSKAARLALEQLSEDDSRLISQAATEYLASLAGPATLIGPSDAASNAVEPTVPISYYTDPTIQLPFGITVGPDGALWFTNRGTDSIGRITTEGVVSNYTHASIVSPWVITAGPDGALWFTNEPNPRGGRNSIGRINTTGVVSNYSDPSIDGPIGITAGPDGALWFTNFTGNSIGRISTSGDVSKHVLGRMLKSPAGITVGPDGALWFTTWGSNSIGRITTTGDVSQYKDASMNDPNGIAPGPDGALWFTNWGGNSIGRITTTGDVSQYKDASMNDSNGITTGPDGALWFTNCGGNSIGRITASGDVSNYTDANVVAPLGITAGPDGALWFTNGHVGGSSIGRIAIVNANR